jgi:hypothetical protein
MSEFDVLRELVGHLPPPAYDDLVAVARKRRRRRIAIAAAGVGAAFVAVGMAVASLSGGTRTEEPAPSPTESSPVIEGWTPERIREEGTLADQTPATRSGLAAAIYVVCNGPGCDGADGPSEFKHRALEVTQQGRRTLRDQRDRWSRSVGQGAR